MFDFILNLILLIAAGIVLLPFGLIVLVTISHFNDERIYRKVRNHLSQFNEGDWVDYYGVVYHYRGDYFRGSVYIEDLSSGKWVRLNYKQAFKIKPSRIRKTPLWKTLSGEFEEE